jgi:hypothetical protein
LVISGRCTRRVPGFDDDRDVQAPERERATGMEEIGGQERGGVGAQETLQDPSCPDVGGMRWARRIFRMVAAACTAPQ